MQSPQMTQALLGALSVLLMLGGTLLVFANDLTLGAVCLLFGAALAPATAWWRRRNADEQ
jgi:hypothetical protein